MKKYKGKDKDELLFLETAAVTTLKLSFTVSVRATRAGMAGAVSLAGRECWE